MSVEGLGIWAALVTFFKAVKAGADSILAIRSLREVWFIRTSRVRNPGFHLVGIDTSLDLADIAGKRATFTRADQVVCRTAGTQTYKIEFGASGAISDFQCEPGIIQDVEKHFAHHVVTIQLGKPCAKGERITITGSCLMSDAFTSDTESMFIDVKNKKELEQVRAKVTFPSDRPPMTLSYWTRGKTDRLPFAKPEADSRLEGKRTVAEWRIAPVKSKKGYVLEWRW